MAGGIDFGTEDALDLWKTTRENYPWLNKFDVLQERHDYPVMNRWCQEKKTTFLGGTQIIHDVMLDDSGAAQMILPNAVRTYDVDNVMAQINVPWRQINSFYVTNFQEMSRNRGSGQRLVNLLDVRRTDSAYSLANKLEDIAWKTPASSTDNVNPYGVPYWVTPITTAQVSAGTTGHIGANPYYLDGNAIANTGGIDASTSPNSRWRNYVDVWSNNTFEMTETDVEKVVKMMYEINFKPPRNATDIENGFTDRFRFYTSLVVLLAMEKKARLNNDSLGADLGRFAGSTVVRGIAVERVDSLDEADLLPNGVTHPFFALNHDAFMPFVMEGDFFRETGPMNDVAQPDTFITNVDMQFNFICRNRRQQGVIVYET